MNHSPEFRTRDGLKLSYDWQPVSAIETSEVSPRVQPTIVLIHGLAEHRGRYDQVIAHLNQNGFQVVRFDQRGHGKSEGSRTHATSHAQFVQDLLDFTEQIVVPQTSGPIAVYAHSFGGGVALRTLLEEAHPFAAAVITSPLIEPAKPVPGWTWCLGEIASLIYPRLRFPLRLQGNQLSHLDEVKQDYDLDPLNSTTVTARLGREMLTHGKRLLQLAPELKTPTLLMHGDADSITSFQASKEFANSASQACDFVRWQGSYHELHHEANVDEVLDTITKWLHLTLS